MNEQRFHRFTIDVEVELTDPDALAQFTTRVTPDGVTTPDTPSKQAELAASRLMGVFAQMQHESGLRPLLSAVSRRRLDADGNYAEVTLPKQPGRDADGKRRWL